MSEKQEHRKRYNEKLQYIADFENWLEMEPPFILFFKWRKWINSRPKRTW